MSVIRFAVDPEVSDVDLNVLFSTARPNHVRRSFASVHKHSLGFICAYYGPRLVGYVNVAWDGAEHAFLLDPTVHPDVRRRDIGTSLLMRAQDLARRRGARWLHVDFEPELGSFYRRAGFVSTQSGLVDLLPPRSETVLEYIGPYVAPSWQAAAAAAAPFVVRAPAPAPPAPEPVLRPSRAARTARRAFQVTLAISATTLLLLLGIRVGGLQLAGRSAANEAIHSRRVIATPIPTPRATPAAPPFVLTPGDGVALTFDDGPNPAATVRVLDILDRYGVKATFFVIGRQAVQYPNLIAEIVNRGHLIGGHTWSHVKLATLPDRKWHFQVEHTNDVLQDMTGRKVHCVRPPAGSYDARVVAKLAERDVAAVRWTIDPRDWTKPGTAVIARRVIAGLRPGAVILMHDGGGFRGQTVDALPKIIEATIARKLPVRPIC